MNNFCNKCGNKLNEGVSFCEKCGTSVLQGKTNTYKQWFLDKKVFLYVKIIANSLIAILSFIGAAYHYFTRYSGATIRLAEEYAMINKEPFYDYVRYVETEAAAKMSEKFLIVLGIFALCNLVFEIITGVIKPNIKNPNFLKMMKFAQVLLAIVFVIWFIVSNYIAIFSVSNI